MFTFCAIQMSETISHMPNVGVDDHVLVQMHRIQILRSLRQTLRLTLTMMAVT